MRASRVVVIAAVANSAIAIVKLVAAFATSSSAMTAEAIHSIVDTMNEVLLYVGLSRARRGPDESHPYGHGKELYFWSLVVAMVVFGAGGCLSLYEGVRHLVASAARRQTPWTFVVLGTGFVFEGVSWYASRRGLRAVQRNRTVWQTIRQSKDPSVFTVFVEDSAAITGLLLAAVGIGLDWALGTHVFDPIASILIGLLLAGASLLLIRESRGLLVGESAASERELAELVCADPNVIDARRPLTMQLGPKVVLATIEVTFRPMATGADLIRAIAALDASIRKRFPSIAHLFIEPQLGH